jgi:hypothetical protein
MKSIRFRYLCDVFVIVQLFVILGHLTLVRYEDMALNPMDYAKKLYAKLNLHFTDSVQQWIKDHTVIRDILANPHSTVRDSRSAAFSWISRLDITEAIEIQEYCEDVMKQLGYKVIDFDYD